MTRYAGNAAALRALVREQEVHRDVYVSEEVFQLEMEHMFPNSWVYVGHDSQVPRLAATPENSSAAPTMPGASRPTARCSRFP